MPRDTNLVVTLPVIIGRFIAIVLLLSCITMAIKGLCIDKSI